MRTPVCDMLGIEFPILAFSHCRDVVAAVSKAGGLGRARCGGVHARPARGRARLDRERGGRPALRRRRPRARQVRRRRGGRPRRPTSSAALIPDEHREFVDDILERYGVPPLPEDEERRRGAGPAVVVAQGRAAAARRGASPTTIRLIANALGPAPPEFMVDAGPRAATCSSPGSSASEQHAERQVAAGVDIIVAQGYEAGGHTGEIAHHGARSPRSSTRSRRRRCSPPAASATAARSRRRMALGAQGVWCGSVWLTTEEAETHPVVKEKFLAATSSRHGARRGRPPASPPASCARRGPTSGTTPPTPIRCRCRCTACSSPRPSCACARSAASNDGRRAARELLRRPGRRADEPGQAGRAGRARHGRGVHRRRRAGRGHDRRVMDPVVARKTWRTVEPLHGVDLLLGRRRSRAHGGRPRGGPMCYFGSRAAAMGPVPAEVVIATFFNFNPDFVCRVIPTRGRGRRRRRSPRRGWRAPTRSCATRSATRPSRRRRWPKRRTWLAAPPGRVRATRRASPVRSPRRPRVARPAAPPAVARADVAARVPGDGHVALLCAEGLRPTDAARHPAATGEVPAGILQQTRGWPDGAWAAAVDRMRTRRLRRGRRAVAAHRRRPCPPATRRGPHRGGARARVRSARRGRVRTAARAAPVPSARRSPMGAC